MKVRLKRRMAGPDGNFAPGQTIDVPEPVAVALVITGSAEYAEPMPTETAMLDVPVETTALPVRKRGRPRKVRNG